ncbi:MAG TPA: carboxypeptidase regulatory-like domain-containing protein, partial [Thermoanaerobaculia bacterium]|nr:carboxypeptidase regulatory-like domain-containing protein [Thermoanaerobaculia bacterium]
SGTVKAADGSALPGAAVAVRGDLLPAGRTTATDAQGAFGFQRLLPGSYGVTAELSGLGTVSREVVVALDKDTQVELVLNPAMAEEISVTAAVPVIDVKSSEVQTNYRHEEIEDLPIPRTYKGLFELSPGVSENNRLAPNAGGSRMDNTFLLDGINITNPHYGDIFPNVTELDIDEVSLKRGGISAEFGRTGGMVVNVITKSGTNQIKGEARFEYQPAAWVSDSKLATLQNTTDRDAWGIGLGGPFVRDRLWWYGSASSPTLTETDRRNQLGSVPDRELSTDEYFGKVTANPVASQLLSGSYRSRDTTNQNAGIGANVHPSVASNDTTDYELATFGWTWLITPNSFLEVKVNHNKEENGTDPVTNFGYRPTFDPAHPENMGRFTTTADRIVGGANTVGQIVGGSDLAINNQDFTRDELRATFQSFQEWFGLSHDVRVGVSYSEDEERLERRANGWGTVTWNPTTKLFTASYVSAQPPHTGRGKGTGVFLQDQVTIGERTTVTAGLLVSRDEYFGEALGSTPGSKRKVKILTFDWDQEIQPRLGISYVPRLDVGDKVYGNFGRYYNTDNKSLVRAASPTRIFTTRATFDATGKLISDVPAANTQNKKVDPGLDPQYTDEWVAGYATPLGAGWAVDLWGIYRKSGDIMEDVSADGLGTGPFHISQLDDAYRKYRAVTLQVSSTPRERWLGLALTGSYTWSRFKGNWDIDFGGNSPFYNSSFIQDGPGVLITDNRDGLLRGDRTNVAKVFASIQPFPRFKVGSYVRYQSGGAWEARGLPDANVSSSSHFRYLESAGSRRMEDWLNVNLQSSYAFELGGFELEIEGVVANVFNEQVELAVDDRLIVGRATAPNNPLFGTPTDLSQPRSYLLSAIVRY